MTLSLTCKSIGCCHPAVPGEDFCLPCINREVDIPDSPTQSLSERYPDRYKPVGDLAEIDVYAVHHIFSINDPSGALQQASLKVLMSGSSPHVYQDIKEARDLLTRWLQLNRELNT
jgi:hypothetical protein